MTWFNMVSCTGFMAKISASFRTWRNIMDTTHHYLHGKHSTAFWAYIVLILLPKAAAIGFWKCCAFNPSPLFSTTRQTSGRKKARISADTQKGLQTPCSSSPKSSKGEFASAEKPRPKSTRRRPNHQWFIPFFTPSFVQILLFILHFLKIKLQFKHLVIQLAWFLSWVIFCGFQKHSTPWFQSIMSSIYFSSYWQAPQAKIFVIF